VFNETSPHRHLQSFTAYYHRSRTHLGLQKDTPESRLVQLPEAGRIISLPALAVCTIATSGALRELRRRPYIPLIL